MGKVFTYQKYSVVVDFQLILGVIKQPNQLYFDMFEV